MLRFQLNPLKSLMVLYMFVFANITYADTCQIDVPSQVVLSNYDPSINAPAQHAFTVRIRAVTACRARLQVDRLDGVGSVKLVGSGSAGLRVRLAQDMQFVVPLQASPNDLASWNLTAGQIVTYVIWMSPIAQQWVNAGSYQVPMQLRLVNSTGSTLDQRDVAIVMKSEATTKIAFSGTGSRSARLDFGELSSGARRSTALDAWANTPYRVTLSSLNRGYLQNTSVSKNVADSKIAYNARLNGVPISLSVGFASLMIQNLGQTRHQLDVDIAAVQRLLAGEYRDDLLITVAAQ